MKECYDGIVGLALADAMGVPVEFLNRDTLKQVPVTGVTGYGTYNMPEGCWSDDTSLTLATMDGIVKNCGIMNDQTYDYIADNFVSYLLNGKFTPTGKMFDVGNTTSQAILRYYYGETPATKSGGTSPENAGNGALMRILPIAYYAHNNNLNDTETLNIVSNVSSITHGLDTCILGSYIYTQFAKKLLEGFNKEEAYKYIQSLNYNHFPDKVVSEYDRILKNDISKVPEEDISSLGKTQPTLEASLWSFMNTDNYNDSVLKAINLGEDTDTVGACTGGLSGLYYGSESINKDWLSQLKNHEFLKDLCHEYDNSIKDFVYNNNFER